MHLGSIYLIVRDFKKSVAFYEKLLDMPVSGINKDRFAQFMFGGHNISIMNGCFDAEHPDMIITKGDCPDLFGDALSRALAPNTNKFVLNFWVEDLRAEYKRVRELRITDRLSPVQYFCYVSPYYFFQMADPDDNMIEVTGAYTPGEGEFEE